MARFENIIRPFVTIDSQPINRIFRRVEPTTPAPVAAIEWGDGSSFVFPPDALDNGENTIRSINVIWPDDGGDIGRRVLQEIARETSDIRVENPDDPAQFVVVERIERLLMRDSAFGETIEFVFSNPEPEA